MVTFALFLNNQKLATVVLREVGNKRIAEIEPDGRQPLELARTKAWSYSVGNLAGLMALARLGEHVDVDLWSFESKDGRSISAALDFLAPYGVGEREWKYPQINGFSAELFDPLLRIATAKYPSRNYQQLAAKLPPVDVASRSKLLLSPLNSVSGLHVR